MKNYILEVCADSVESALSAKAGGATRLELCANLVIGGTTPGYELFEQVKKETGLPIRVLIRPRFGDFLYSEYEYQQMLCDVRHFAEAGADGVVIGSLNADGTLNEVQMRGLAGAAGDCGITLHRAFDVCVDPMKALEEAIDLGFDTILTSGQKETAWEGKEMLKALQEKSAGRIEILAASGIGAESIEKLLPYTGITSYHMSGKIVVDSMMKYRKEGIGLGLSEREDYALWQTSKEEIVKAVKVLKG